MWNFRIIIILIPKYFNYINIRGNERFGIFFFLFCLWQITRQNCSCGVVMQMLLLLGKKNSMKISWIVFYYGLQCFLCFSFSFLYWSFFFLWNSNIATAYFEMELYRKCETQCEKALLADKKNIHARILKGESFFVFFF